VRTLIAFVVALVVATAAAGAAEGAERAIPSAGRVVARIPVAGAPLGLLTEPGAVWVTGHHSNFVYRIDPSTDRIAAKVDVIGAWSAQPGRLLGVGGKVIAASYSGRRVAVVDPARNRVVRTFSTPFEICCWPAYGAGSLWLLGYSSPSAANPDRLMRVDLATGCQGAPKSAPVSGVEKCTTGSLEVDRRDRLRFELVGGALTACEESVQAIGRPVSAVQAESRSGGA
jgi:hypothetical protein